MSLAGVQDFSCLGEPDEYRVSIYWRKTATQKRLHYTSLPGTCSVRWDRRLNDVSEASAETKRSNASENCCDKLREIDNLGGPIRFELEIERVDPSQGGASPWTGPLLDVEANPEADTISVSAVDHASWMKLRVFTQDFTATGDDLATIFKRYVTYGLSVDNPGMTVSATPVGISGDRTVAVEDVRTIWQELLELTRTGVDWTVLNGQWLVGGRVIGGEIQHVFSPDDFRVQPTSRLTSRGQATQTFTRGSAQIVGVYGGVDPDGVLIQRVQHEDSIEDQGSADAASQTWHQRVMGALKYLEKDNDLASDAKVTIGQLIPGMKARVDMPGLGCVPFNTDLRLSRVTGTWTPTAGERIKIALEPVGTDAATLGSL